MKRTSPSASSLPLPTDVPVRFILACKGVCSQYTLGRVIPAPTEVSMKTQFVSELQEGDSVHDYFVATRKDLRDQSSGSKFLGMVFKDRTGEIGGILWNNAEAIARLFEVGDVVSVRGRITSYQSRLQIRVEQVLPLKDGEYDTADLVPAPEGREGDMKRFRAILDTIENEWLAKLVGLFLEDDDFMARFADAAAGRKWHHAYPGGLLRHCCEVARLAVAACEVFPVIDRDLVLTAVFLHDIGKLEEMSHELFIEYTTVGKLIGHLELGAEMVRRRMDTIEGFPDTLRWQLLHCVLSHHGELVNGSAVVPKTLEAIVLSHCDDLDAQADAVCRIVQETADKHQAWSEYITLIERQIWTKKER